MEIKISDNIFFFKARKQEKLKKQNRLVMREERRDVGRKEKWRQKEGKKDK